MSRGVRLPTLYPMPRDKEQYWVCYQASLAEPTAEDFKRSVRKELIRERDGRPYSERMVANLVSNLAGIGFLARSGRRILPPDPFPFGRFSWDGTWDGSSDGFREYVDKTILKWCWWWPDGLQLAYDLLSALDGSESGLGIAQLWDHLKIDQARGTGRYDGGDRHGARTVGEALRIMEFAEWVEVQGGKRVVTSRGRARRPSLRNRDTYHRIERILATIDPLSTDIFNQSQWIDLTKLFMWRESGGKGRRTRIRRIRDRLFKNRYSASLRSEIRSEIDRSRRTLVALRSEITRYDTSLGRRVENLRNAAKLVRIRDHLAEGEVQQAELSLDSSGARLSSRALLKLKHPGPDYSLDPSLVPHRWQSEALRCWIDAGGRGVLQVVTGAGKTFLALLAVEKLLKSHPELRVSVLVPTKVLMYQWVMELVRLLGVPPDDIGLRGDGHKDALAEGRRIVVNIINSAILDDQLRQDAASLPPNTPHLLIADECHRYRGRAFRRAFGASYDFSLGLSATLGDSSQASSGENSEESGDPLLLKLGSLAYEYTYQQARSDGVVQPFEVYYVGVELSRSERSEYEAYSKRIRTALQKIRQRYGPRIDAMPGPFFARLHTILHGDERPDPAIPKYFEAVRERKELVYRARNRKWAYLDIVAKHAVRSDDREDRIIVFDERIENVQEVVAPMDGRKARQLGPVERQINNQLARLLWHPGFRAVMYHSARSKPLWNETSMDFFREGWANVMLSVKALVEGVDVPAANVGIIRASSSSVRQRIQTTGRILRRATGKNSAAKLYVIYVRDTTDERIFHGTDWAEQLGSSQIRWVHWSPPTDPGSPGGDWREGHPPDVESGWEKETVPEFDVGDLTPGDPYPGAYAGREYHVDASGRPFKKTRNGRQRITNVEVATAAALVLQLKRGGKFVITPENHMITRVGRELVFLGVLDGEPEWEPATSSRVTQTGGPPTFEELFGGRDV